MTPSHPNDSGRRPDAPNGNSRVIAIIALLALVVGVSLAFRQSRPARPAAPPPAVPLEEPGEGVVEEALMQIPGVDSVLIKSRWVDQIGNVDVSAMNPAQLELLVRHANARRCTCGCGYTLAACRMYDPTCPESGPVVEALRDSILAGDVRSADGLRPRPEPSEIGHP